MLIARILSGFGQRLDRAELARRGAGSSLDSETSLAAAGSRVVLTNPAKDRCSILVDADLRVLSMLAGVRERLNGAQSARCRARARLDPVAMGPVTRERAVVGLPGEDGVAAFVQPNLRQVSVPN